MTLIRGARVGAVALAALATFGVAIPVATAGTPRASADDDAALTSVETLLSSIQSDLRPTCARRDPATFANGSFEGALAIVECAAPTDDVAGVVYALYPDAATMNAEYQQIVPAGLAPMKVADGCTGAGTWAYGDGNPTEGSAACYSVTVKSGPISKMVWTRDASHILASAATQTTDGDALKKWWQTGRSLVLAQPDTLQFASTDPADRIAAGKALVKQTSKAVTKCKQSDTDVSVFASDTAEWAWMPWLQAEQVCKVPGGVAYFAQVAPDAAKGFWTSFRDHLTDAGRAEKHPTACKDPRDIVDAKDRTIGQVQCWYYHGTLWANWYDSKAGVVGAAQVRSTPQKIFDYLDHNKLV